MRIVTLMEDSPSRHRSLIAEHGLSFYIEAGGRRLLFDMGAGPHFLDNAYTLGIDVSSLDAIVISHSHYDHAGGFRPYADRIGTPCPLYVGKGFFGRKYSSDDGMRFTDLSAGFSREFAESRGFGVRECWSDTEIFPGIMAVADFERECAEEKIPERFVKLGPDGFVRDDFQDEIALAIQTSGGLVLITGCAHPGIVNMASAVRKRYGSIRAIYGGTHLAEAGDERIIMTLETMRGYGVETLGMCHCTGSRAAEIASGCRISLLPLSAGDTVFAK